MVRRHSTSGQYAASVGSTTMGSLEAHLLSEVLPDVRVIPVEAGVGELDLAAVTAADRDRLLGLVPNPVVSVLRPQTVPVHRRRDVAVFRVCTVISTLLDLQGRTGHGAVVGEHPQLGAAKCDPP